LAGQPPEPWQSYSPPSAQAFGQDQANVRPAPGYQADAYGAADPGAPPWQQPAQDMPATRVNGTGGDAKGFLGALFDFGFTSFVTPKIIKVLYVLYTIWMVVWALIFLRLGFKYGGAGGGIAVLILVVPVFLLLTLGAFRVVLELFMVIHRIHDDLKAIRERSDERR
jgi:Domain of unknown function (DUF4282)